MNVKGLLFAFICPYTLVKILVVCRVAALRHLESGKGLVTHRKRLFSVCNSKRYNLVITIVNINGQVLVTHFSLSPMLAKRLTTFK